MAIESCKRLLEKDADAVEIPLNGIIIMVITIAVKGVVRLRFTNVSLSRY